MERDECEIASHLGVRKLLHSDCRKPFIRILQRIDVNEYEPLEPMFR
jgi:hypothetical protein